MNVRFSNWTDNKILIRWLGLQVATKSCQPMSLIKYSKVVYIYFVLYNAYVYINIYPLSNSNFAV